MFSGSFNHPSIFWIEVKMSNFRWERRECQRQIFYQFTAILLTLCFLPSIDEIKQFIKDFNLLTGVVKIAAICYYWPPTNANKVGWLLFLFLDCLHYHPSLFLKKKKNGCISESPNQISLNYFFLQKFNESVSFKVFEKSLEVLQKYKFAKSLSYDCKINKQIK